MVLIVRDADQLSFASIEKKIAELAKRARDGKIAFTDLEGGIVHNHKRRVIRVDDEYADSEPTASRDSGVCTAFRSGPW
ncbi:MAG: 2-oxo acid dehydrogenase subunit E2 [Gemmataceae bacterium]